MATRLFLLVLGVLLLPFTGCDAVTATDAIDAPPMAPEAKLRHWDLLPTSPGGSTPDGTAARGAASDSVSFIVTFADLVEDPEAAAAFLFHGQAVRKRTYYRDSFTGVSVTAHEDELYDVLNDLIASDSVAFVEPDIPLDPVVGQAEYVDLNGLSGYDNNEWYGDQLRPWSVKRIDAQQSWAASGDGQGRVDIDVYVIDGPIDHPDLNVVERVSFLPAEVAPATPLHGNHVAGILAAEDDGDGVVGVAPGARIHSLEVLDASGSSSLSALLDAVEFVVKRKQEDPDRPLVANMSVGVDLGTTEMNALDEAVEKAVELGVVVVVSAGNGAADAATYSPAHAPGALVVGASDPYDHFAGTFSNFGAEIDLFAPGVDILSTADEGRYAVLSGTSMATPHVAGTAALYLAQNPSASPAQVLERLRNRAQEIQNNGLPSGTTRYRVRAQGL